MKHPPRVFYTSDVLQYPAPRSPLLADADSVSDHRAPLSQFSDAADVLVPERVQIRRNKDVKCFGNHKALLVSPLLPPILPLPAPKIKTGPETLWSLAPRSAIAVGHFFARTFFAGFA